MMIKRRSTTCSTRLRRAGLTLVEVVAAIAILGVVLVGIVLAKSRHTRQLAVAERKHEAVRVADALISQWWTRPEGVPINEQGIVDNHPSLRWETRLVQNRPIDELGARVLRVELHVANPDESPLDPDDHKLVTVDLVLPMPQDEQANGDKTGNTPQRGGGHE